MSRARRKGVLQLATWISAHLKEALVARARAEKRSQRDVLEEALVAKLGSSDTTPQSGPETASV